MKNHGNTPKYRFDKKFVRNPNETPEQQRNRILSAMRPEIRRDPLRCAKAMTRALEMENTDGSDREAHCCGRVYPGDRDYENCFDCGKPLKFQNIRDHQQPENRP